MDETTDYKEIIKALDEATQTGTSRRSLGAVSKATGFTTSWLSQFINGDVKDAGYQRVCKIKSWLKETQNTSNHKNNHPRNGASPSVTPFSTPHRATNKTPSGAVSGIHSEGVGQ